MDYAVVALVMVLSFALYVKTLAPTIVWGDPAKLTTFAYNCRLGVWPGNHALRTLVGCIWGQLPFADYAFGQNLLSAVFASLTVGVVCLIGFTLRVSRLSAGFGSLALGVSHTFWWLAVMAESYSLLSFLLSVCILAAIMWGKSRDNRWLYLFAFVFGLGITNHGVMFLFAPAFVLYFLLEDQRFLFRYRSLVGMGVSFVAGLSLLIVLFVASLHSTTVGQLIHLMTISELHWEGTAKVVRETLMYVLYLGYQFPGLALLLGALGAWGLFFQDKKAFALLASVFAADIVFSAGYPYQRQFMILLPSYLVFSLAVGVGTSYAWDKICLGVRRKVTLVISCVMLGGLLILVPLVTYYTVPSVLRRSGFSPLNIRTLPYRDTALYFFLPDKSSYFGAARYGRGVLEILPPHSVVLADFITGVVLEYLQTVEGFRPDVTIVRIENRPPGKRTLEAVNQHSGRRQIYLTDYRDHAQYFAVNKLSQEYEFVSQGLVFLLRKKG